MENLQISGSWNVPNFPTTPWLGVGGFSLDGPDDLTQSSLLPLHSRKMNAEKCKLQAASQVMFTQGPVASVVTGFTGNK